MAFSHNNSARMTGFASSFDAASGSSYLLSLVLSLTKFHTSLICMISPFLPV